MKWEDQEFVVGFSYRPSDYPEIFNKRQKTMPTHTTPDFTQVSAGFPMVEKDDYRLKVGKPKGKIGVDKNGNEYRSVSYPLIVVDAKGQGKKYIGKKLSEQRCSMQDAIGVTNVTDIEFFRSMTKQFLLAAAGYTRNEEALANEEFFSQHDWVLEEGDEEGEVTLGEGWGSVEGNEVWVTADIKGDFQQYRGWLPGKASD